jgi:ectoine hydroxylase-related dioxygenase (phytanoyl-CoA dioxygenase family)
MSNGGATFHEDGYALLPSVMDDDYCANLARNVDGMAVNGAGARRLLEQPWCVAAARELRINAHVRSVLPVDSVAVQCTYFQKSTGQNWLVALHQDLSIPVSARIADEACSGWSEKEGILFVQPPIEVLEQLVAVRVHLDANTASNGPLRIVPGSHRSGRLTPQEIQSHRLRSGEVECLAPASAAVAMRPLLLHASSKAQVPALRRVLHFVFGPPTLPCGLEWKHAV